MLLKKISRVKGIADDAVKVENVFDLSKRLEGISDASDSHDDVQITN